MAAFSRVLKNTESTQLRAIPRRLFFRTTKNQSHDALAPLLKVADDTVAQILGDRLLWRLD